MGTTDDRSKSTETGERLSLVSNPSHLRVAVAGAGAFGRNHLRVYRELRLSGAPVTLAAIIEGDASLAAALAAEYAVPVFASAAECAAHLRSGGLHLDAASVCVPTVHHAAVAETLLSAGLDLLIEKPFAATLAEADTLIALAQQHHRILQIGHLERFNPAVTAAAAHLDTPMFFEAHRLSIFTPRSLDVDVVLDLMIHDLDVVLSFVQSPVREVRAVGLPVLSRKVDIANVRVEFESGCIANFTASRVSTERVRKLRFFQPHQYISLDYARQDALIIDVTAAASAIANPALLAALQAAPSSAASLPPSFAPTPAADSSAAAASYADSTLPPHPSSGLAMRKLSVAPGEPLRLEIESFLHAVRTRTTPHVTAAQGRNALALALEINRTIADHSQRAGLHRFIQT